MVHDGGLSSLRVHGIRSDAGGAGRTFTGTVESRDQAPEPSGTEVILDQGFKALDFATVMVAIALCFRLSGRAIRTHKIQFIHSIGEALAMNPGQLSRKRRATLKRESWRTLLANLATASAQLEIGLPGRAFRR